MIKNLVKLLAAAVLTAAVLFGINACSKTRASASDGYSRFYVSETCEVGPLYSVAVVVDRKTGCQYGWFLGYEKAGATVLVDRDGKPLLSDEAGE